MRVDSVFARLVYTESQKFNFKSFAFNAISAVVGAGISLQLRSLDCP